MLYKSTSTPPDNIEINAISRYRSGRTVAVEICAAEWNFNNALLLKRRSDVGSDLTESSVCYDTNIAAIAMGVIHLRETEIVLSGFLTVIGPLSI